VDSGRLDFRVIKRQVIESSQARTLNLVVKWDILYVVRNKGTGQTQVGRTTPGRAADDRFLVYDRVGVELGINVEIEVFSIDRPKNRTIESCEQALRDQLDYGARGLLPWDNTRVKDIGSRLEGRARGSRGPGYRRT
jgi:hypothetical protein